MTTEPGFALCTPVGLLPQRSLKFSTGEKAVRHQQSYPVCEVRSPEHDAIIVGSGLGGLCTAALLAAHGRKTLVFEAHDTPGGAAHAFQRKTPKGQFTFVSGPHLYSGLTAPSRNPLHHVLQAANIDLPVNPYETWGVHIPEGEFRTSVLRNKPFLQSLMTAAGGPGAAEQVARMVDAMRPLGEAATALPPALIRAGDFLGTLRIIVPRMLDTSVLKSLPYISKLQGTFEVLLNDYVTDPFARNFLNLLCFLLAGVEADRIPLAEIAFLFREWVGDDDQDESAPPAVLQHPVGGAPAIANSLISAIERQGASEVRTRAIVSRVLVENGKAVGVQLSNGQRYYAKAVISNVSALDVPDLLPEADRSSVERDTEMCDSFMHINCAVHLTEEVRSKLPAPLFPNYVSVRDWSRGLDDRDNVVLVSIPSVVDPSVCPTGYAVVHAYTPATEPYDNWEDLKPGSEAYERFKEERSVILWAALDRIFGQSVKDIAEFPMVGTPKTHERFLRRKRGSYGPKVNASKGGLGLPFPWNNKMPTGFYRVGDGVFPGIGVPAVAGSAWIVANSLVDVDEQDQLLRRIGL